MRLRKRGLTAGAIVAAAALALAACTGGGDSGGGGAGGAGGTFSMSIKETQTGPAPSNCYDLYCAQVDQILYTGLFKYVTDDSGAMVPENSEMTESVTPSNDNKRYTIKIKSGWKFTDGEAITAQTFVDTFNYTANGGNGQQLGFLYGPTQLNVVGYDKVAGENSTDGKMSGLKAVDETTLQMDLVAPMNQTLFMNFMAGPQVFPMPKVAFEDLDAYQKNPIGNGQYKLQGAWANDSGGTFVKNPDHPGTAGNADTIEIRVYSTDEAEWADLQGNTLDVTASLPNAALSQAPTVLGDRFINIPGGLQYSYYGFDVNDPTFKDKNVRLAVARSINVDEINQKLYFGTRQVPNSFAPATIPGGGTDLCGDNCVFDATAAKQLLQQAGGIKGQVHVTRLADEPTDIPTAICNQVQSNLGVECVVDTYKSFGVLAQAQEDGEVPNGTLLGNGWVADNPTIHNMVTANFTCENANNYTGYCNEEVDKLLQEGVSAANEEEQISKWQEAERIILSDFQAWPFQFRNQVGGYSTRVSGVTINPGGFVNLAEITVSG